MGPWLLGQEAIDDLKGLLRRKPGESVAAPPQSWPISAPAIVIRGAKGYGNIPAADDADHPGVGQILLDILDSDVPQFGNADSANPRTVYNLTGVAIQDGDRLIVWRDLTATKGAGGDKTWTEAWYCGGIGGQMQVEMPMAILSYTSAPVVVPAGAVAFDLRYEARRTNDPATFGFMLGDNENPVNLTYDGIRIRRAGDYLIRWGFCAEINGVQEMSELDDPPQNSEDDYIIDHYETARWRVDVMGYRLGPTAQVFSSDSNSGGTNPGTLVYFVNFAEAKPFTGEENESFQADRVIRLRFQMLNAYNSISVTRPFLEIMRLGPMTEAGH